MNIDLKEVLKRHKISIQGLADKMKINRQTVYYYIEQGDKLPLNKLEELANNIGCSLGEMIGTEKEQSNGISFTCPNCGSKLKLIKEE